MTLSGRYETRATKENDSGSNRALVTSLAKGPVLSLSESWMRFSLTPGNSKTSHRPAVKAAVRAIAKQTHCAEGGRKESERTAERGIAARQRRCANVSVPQSVPNCW